MNNNSKIYLNPVDSRKSFYGKCYIVKNPINGMIDCYSYDTRVASYNPDNGHFLRRWSGYSATTMRHVNSFAAYCGIKAGGKKWWDSLIQH